MGNTIMERPRADPRPVSVLLLDDHPLMLGALRMVIERQPDWKVCGQATDPAAALRLAGELQPDVAVVEITLHAGNGIDVVKQLKAEFPAIRTLVYSSQDEMLYAERAIRAGAMAYVSKQEPPETLIAAIEKLMRGQLHLSPRVESHLLQHVPRRSRRSDTGPISQLSDRELQTFELIGQGMTTRGIAEQLAVSVKTIDAYRQRIKSKLKVNTSNELMRRAVEWAIERA